MNSALLPGTEENIERSGSRNDLTLSGALRELEGVKVLDVDGYTYNPKTYQIECYFEATSSKRYDPWTKTFMARKQAEAMGAFTMLVTHAYGDSEREKPLIIHLWGDDGKPYTEYWNYECSWSDWKEIVDAIRDSYTEGSN